MKLTTVDSIKFLGLTLDNSLSWKKHIEAMVPKLSAATFAIRVVQPFFVLRLFEIDILLILPFNLMVWNNILG